MVRKQFERDWPGDPHAAWREAANATMTCRTHSLPRPALPDWRDFDVFTRQVSVPPTTPSPLGTVGVGLFFVLCAWLKDFRGFFGIGFAVLAALLVIAGLCFLWYERPRQQQRRVCRVYGRCLAHGVGGHAYRTSFAYIWGENSSTETTTSLLIDERLPDDAAAQLQHAVRIWLARVLADPHMKSQAADAYENRFVVPVSEIFGPEATGAWLIRDQEEDDTPWRLLIDRPNGVREYLFDEILVSADGRGGLYLDEPRHDEIGDRMPHF